ncbi:MAG TPA: hypothetical protein VM431_00635 [Phycisphaerae bacterium]|nr:hypothetical protein [Phycisphaerae bacterium]
MTVSHPPSSSRPHAAAPRLSAGLRALGILLLVVPMAGLVLHLALYGLLDPEMLKAYVHGPWLKAAAIVAFVNLVGNWFHYRKTRMGLDVASRIMTYLWVISMIVLLRVSMSVP